MKVNEMWREGSKMWLINRCWLAFKKLVKDMSKKDWFKYIYTSWVGATTIIAVASGIYWPVVLIWGLPFVPKVRTAYIYRDSGKWPLEWHGSIPND